ncbi:MAG TPA: M50 family metallopeptidase [Blastocatellia bacterium]|nr:M50 family metallopeptidase [Blastocatellia bacterium]
MTAGIFLLNCGAERLGSVVLRIMPKTLHKNHKESIGFLLGATALTIVVSYLPFGFLVVYPLRLFVTFIHEGGHALAALLTLGSVSRLVIHANASGETYTYGGLSFLISSAGYLASTAYGAGLLTLLHDGGRAKAVLTVTAAIILTLTGFFTADSFSLFIGIALTGLLIWVAIGWSARWAHFFLSFLAVQCCLNALYDLKTLFLISATTNMHSDAVNMQEATTIPAIVWVSFWIIISILALVFALRIYAQNLGLISKPAKMNGVGSKK